MVQQQYNRWLGYPGLDRDLAAELTACAGQNEDIRDRFYRDLEFGTGGLRGILGAGTNRVNRYTVAGATRGLAAYLLEMEHAPRCAVADATQSLEQSRPRCAVAFDSRNQSETLARVTAAVLAAAGVEVHLFRELTPTPMLSFAVRHLGCSGGVVITASHNPAPYNGYKVYGPDGCQIVERAAAAISERIGEQEALAPIPEFEPLLQSGRIAWIGEEVAEAYYDNVLALCPLRPETVLRVVYSPLNGAGNKPVRTVLDRLGYVETAVVLRQEHPDGSFPTCPYPNPEEPAAMALAAKLAQETGADLFFATDPDSDRMGAGVLTPEGPRLITGNEMGVLLLDYLCRRRRERGSMPERPVAVTTIVTTRMAAAIADFHGVELREVLTGFKYIGEQIALLEGEGGEDRFLFGFEESYGYLAGTFVRDKDAVIAAALLCEMAACYKSTGTTLLQALDGLYARFGFHQNSLISLDFPGADGMERMTGILDRLRQHTPDRLADVPVTAVVDYLRPDTGLPRSNVLRLELADGSRIILRPSGTEPKLKLYLSCAADTPEESRARMERLRAMAGVVAGN